jgi:transcriptional regulator with GAF, ATPase, and Fis domain
MGLNSLRLSNEAQAALLAYDWPGNVRELEHLIGRSALKALGQHPDRPRSSPSKPSTWTCAYRRQCQVRRPPRGPVASGHPA